MQIVPTLSGRFQRFQLTRKTSVARKVGYRTANQRWWVGVEYTKVIGITIVKELGNTIGVTSG